jgi:hypothetical protein
MLIEWMKVNSVPYLSILWMDRKTLGSSCRDKLFSLNRYFVLTSLSLSLSLSLLFLWLAEKAFLFMCCSTG